MKQIIVVKPNSLDEANKKLLLEADIVLIEHQNPIEVRVINNIDGFEGDDIFNSLVDAIRGTDNTEKPNILFAKSLLAKMAARRAK